MSETLIFIGGEGPRGLEFPDSCSFSSVLACDSGLDLALNLGFSPDLVVGDMDSVTADVSRFRMEKSPSDKDESDFELALAKTEGDYVLVGGGGGRMDHLVSLYSCFFRFRPPRLWLTASDVIFRSRHFEASLEEGTTLSFYPYIPGLSAVVSATGLVWELEDKQMGPSFISLSNRSRGGRTSIRSTEDLAIRFGMDKSLLKAKIYLC